MARPTQHNNSLVFGSDSSLHSCRPIQPPPPLFLGEKERDLVKQVNDELIERVIGQQILYYPVSAEYTNYHPVYGEAINKIMPKLTFYL